MHRQNRRRQKPDINQQLSGIKNTLQKIEGDIREANDHREKLDNILHELQTHYNEIKNHRQKLDNILGELAEVKEHLAQTNRRQSRNRRDRGETQNNPAADRKRKSSPDIGNKGSLPDLLPGNNGKKNGFLDNILGNMDPSQILNILKNPMVQSMLKNFLP